MNKSWFPFPFLSALIVVATLGLSSWNLPGTVVPLNQTAPTPTLPAMTPTEDSWIIVDLPADATQLEYGTEVYRLVCKACHGDKGQGLTDDWRAQWEPEDQNCWQSKCHGLNHPPDGFYMPQVPAVVGEPIRAFGTAQNLYTYNHYAMPWHDRASMTEKESWSVTAYILKINGIDPGPELNAETAAQIDLSVIDPGQFPTPQPSLTQVAPNPELENTPEPLPLHEKQPAPARPAPWMVASTLVVLLAVAVLIVIRRRSSS
jgi:cytochrome c5